MERFACISPWLLGFSHGLVFVLLICLGMAVATLHVIALGARLPPVLNVAPLWRVRWACEKALHELDQAPAAMAEKIPRKVMGSLPLPLVLVEREISHRWCVSDGTINYRTQSLVDLD